MINHEYYGGPVATVNRTVRSEQIDKEQLQNLPLYSHICLHHDHLDKHAIWRLVGLWEKGFVVEKPRGPQIVQRLHYSDYCLEPYEPPQRWNPTNWVSVVWRNTEEQPVRYIPTPPIIVRPRTPYIPPKIDWHKAGF